MSRTLQDFRSRPHTQLMGYGEVTVPQVMQAYKRYQADKSPGKAQPEVLAIDFYLWNAAFAKISQMFDANQPLPAIAESVMGQYYQKMEDIGLRIFFYLMLICTRESRHAKISNELTQHLKQYGAMDFWSTIADNENAASHLMSSAPNTTMLKYTQHLLEIFEKAKFGHSYGGPKWANTTKPLRDFVYGATTLEMMLDTAFTLAHNGGPIFDKGMLFSAYGSDLVKILNAQRVGVVPNMVLASASGYVNHNHRNLCKVMNEHIFSGFADGANFDWDSVNEAAGIANESPNVKKAKEEMEAAVALAVKKQKAKFQIMPSLYVTKISRQELKAA
jgi:hypothetical protein